MNDTERAIRHLKRVGLWPVVVNECRHLGRALEAIAWCYRCTDEGIDTDRNWEGDADNHLDIVDIMADGKYGRELDEPFRQLASDMLDAYGAAMRARKTVEFNALLFFGIKAGDEITVNDEHFTVQSVIAGRVTALSEIPT